MALTLVGAAAPPGASAADTDACQALIATPEPLRARSGVTVLATGDQRVAVGNTEMGGLLCAFAVTGGKVAVSDIATGVDVVGRISGARLMEVQRKAFLAMVQSFRGGSNGAREQHVVYLIEDGKLRKVLELPSLEELTIGDYRLSERNTMAPGADGLHVSQEASVRRASAPEGEALYRTTRRFVLTFAPEVRAFVEGTGECVRDLVIGKGVWLKAGDRFGYLFRPGLARATALSLRLVSQDGRTADTEGAEDLLFLMLGKKPLPRPEAAR
jgi:hypothetical protein